MFKHYTFTILSLFLSISSIFALEPRLKRPVFEHFYEVNKEWKHHATAAPNVNLAFDNDIERISAHLYYVEKELRKNIPKGLNRKALQKRNALLDTLKNYAFAAQFPQNIGHSTRRPYFIDHRGVHCAVGYLMTASGHANLSKQIQKEHNFDYLRDIKTTGVAEWAAEHGFNAEELAWIQPGYLPSNNYAPILNGTDGPVFAICEKVSGNGKLIFIGDFNNADNQPCSNVAYYENGAMHCLGGGLLGDLSSLYSDYYGVNVAGSIENGANLYPAAHFDTVWTYYNIPGRTAAVGTAIGQGFYSNHKLELAISHNSLPGVQEIWYLLNNGSWEKMATVYGNVYDMENFYEAGSSEYLFFYGGAFDSVKIHRNSLPDSTVFAKNLIARDAYTGNWKAYGNEICDTVLNIKTIGNAVYLSGNAGGESFAVSRLANSQLSGLIPAAVFTDSSATINALEFFDDRLILSGTFTSAALIGLYGNNLAKYNLLDNTIEPLGLFNKAVESVLVMNGELYIGGSFDSCYFGQPLPHLAKMGTISSTDMASINEIDLLVYPNPSIGPIHVDLGSKKSDVSTIITDINGRVVKQTDFSETQLIDLDISEFATGLYFLNIKSASENPISKKIVKQ
jgi:hypothetical protein